MKTNFVNDVRHLEAQAQVAVQDWRNRGGSRTQARQALSQSIVKSSGAQDAWREISRHIEIAVAAGQPYFALVELKHVTDGLGRELRRSEPRILSTSDQASEIVRAGYLQLDADRLCERLDRVMGRIRRAGSRLETDPDVLSEITEGVSLSPAAECSSGRMRKRSRKASSMRASWCDARQDVQRHRDGAANAQPAVARIEPTQFQ
jgi:hypothetical protein